MMPDFVVGFATGCPSTTRRDRCRLGIAELTKSWSGRWSSLSQQLAATAVPLKWLPVIDAAVHWFTVLPSPRIAASNWLYP